MTETDTKQSVVVLVVEASAPLRARVARMLRQRGIQAAQAVNIDDALHYLTRTGIPATMILASEIEGNSTQGLVQGLIRLNRTKHLPTVLIVDDAAAADVVVGQDLPPTVVPVIKHKNIETLTTAIIQGVAFANMKYPVADPNALPPEAGEEVAQTSTDVTGISANTNLTELDSALTALDDIIDRISRNKLPGPMLPEALQDIRALTAKSDIEFREIAAFVAKHQTLSIRVLKVANSAFYSRSGKAANIMQALSRLGMNKTIPLLQALAAREFIVGSHKDLNELTSKSLESAYLVAVLAQDLGKQKKHPDPQSLYSLGLFHNIGATFLLYALSLLNKKKKKRNPIKIPEKRALQTMVDSQCARLNGIITKAMKLPAEVAQVYADEEPSENITLIHQAMWFAEKILSQGATPIVMNAEAEILQIDEAALELVNGQAADLLSLLSAYSD